MQSKGLNEEFKEKLKANNNIVNVIGKYVSLSKKGKRYWACCPFHHEKTPSFTVDEIEGFYKCYGCGAGGDVISFVQNIESLNYVETLKYLAKNCGMEMPEYAWDENQRKTQSKKDRMIAINNTAKDYYKKCFDGPFGGVARQYIYEKRGVTSDIVIDFAIGYSANWQGVLTYLKQNGFSEDEAIEAGVCVRGENNVYDAMGLRVVFPICNIYGDCIGFTGRTLSTDKKVAKYRNTGQTLLFDKGSIVYGIDVVKKSRKNDIDSLIVVEGNVDCIMLHQAGFKNAVACMGTALTDNHASQLAKQLFRFSNRLYICFDGDSAGKAATLKGLDILTAEGFLVRVMELPDGLDPDDFIKKFGKEAFADLMNKALPLTDYKIATLAKTYKIDDSTGKRQFLNAAMKLLGELNKTSEMEVYLPLISQITSTSTDNLRRELFSFKQTQNYKQIENENSKNTDTATDKAKLFILASLLNKKNYATPPEEKINFQNKFEEELFEFMTHQNNWIVSNVFDKFAENLDEIKKLLDFKFEIDDEEKYYADCVETLIVDNINQEREKLEREYTNETDQDKKKQIAAKLNATIKLLKGRKNNG